MEDNCGAGLFQWMTRVYVQRGGVRVDQLCWLTEAGVGIGDGSKPRMWAVSTGSGSETGDRQGIGSGTGRSGAGRNERGGLLRLHLKDRPPCGMIRTTKKAGAPTPALFKDHQLVEC